MAGADRGEHEGRAADGTEKGPTVDTEPAGVGVGRVTSAPDGLALHLTQRLGEELTV